MTTIINDNGSYWILLTSHGKHSWEKLVDDGKCLYYRLYCIHNSNIEVIISQTKIFVIENGEYLFAIKPYIKVFIGKDPKKKYSEGNSILVQNHNNEYIYIGSEIYGFRSRDPITQYISKIGADGEIYPYATTKTLTYLLKLGECMAVSSEDPYASTVARRPFPKEKVY